MPKEDAIIRGAKIKYKGTFDFNLLYRKLREWLIREKYSDSCESGEKKYSERIKPSGKQIEVVWSTSKGEEGGYFSLINHSLSFLYNKLKSKVPLYFIFAPLIIASSFGIEH